MSTLETNLVKPSTGTALTIGASGDTITVPSGATFNVAGSLQSGGSAITQGITMADQFRLSANTTAPSGDLTSNLERVDTSGQGTLGTGMTESSGIFSFPSTGIYLIEYAFCLSNVSAGTEDRAQVILKATINNSDYTTITNPDTSVDGSANGATSVGYRSSLIDVTDTSTVKVKFTAQSFKSGTTLSGSTSENSTHFTFIRLGDT